MTYEEARLRVSKACDVDLGNVSVGHEGTALVAHVEIRKGISFAKLAAIAAALGTDKIDIIPADPGRRWSEDTYEPGTPATLRIQGIA